MSRMPREYAGRDLVAMARALERYESAHGRDAVNVDARFLDALCAELEEARSEFRIMHDLVGLDIEAGAVAVRLTRERDEARAALSRSDTANERELRGAREAVIEAVKRDRARGEVCGIDDALASLLAVERAER